MERRTFVGASVAALFAIPMAAQAQLSSTTPSIGFLSNLSPTTGAANLDAFRRGLKDLGWIEGRNILIEYRSADGDMTRHPALASELVKLQVATIVTAGTPAVQAARQASRSIPIVVAIMPDPVALGFAASLARPGGNITGLANLFEELTPKQLQIFREALPNATRIALLSDRSMGDAIQTATMAAARTLGVEARVHYVDNVSNLDTAIRTAKGERADAVLVLPSPTFNRYRARIAELASKAGLPTFSESSEYVRDGGFLSYGPNFPSMYYRAAAYVDRVLKGAKPGDLPIERPTKFELVINLKTAKLLGITVPQSLLQRADDWVQ